MFHKITPIQQMWITLISMKVHQANLQSSIDEGPTS
jgi:hypothetical protein